MKNKKRYIIISSIGLLLSLIFFLIYYFFDRKLIALWLIPLILTLFYVLLAVIVFPQMKEFKPKNSDLPYMDEKLEIEKLLKFSKKSLFGIARIFIGENDYFFDDEAIYEVLKNGQYLKIPFSEIKSIYKTNFYVNNEYIWDINFIYNNEIRSFKFIPTH